MASLVISALESAMYTGSSSKGYYWAFRHPNPDAPPETYRLTRKHLNGWVLLLAASKETKEVLSFYAQNEDDEKAVAQALKWLGISATVTTGETGKAIRLADGTEIPSVLYGGEKKKA